MGVDITEITVNATFHGDDYKDFPNFFGSRYAKITSDQLSAEENGQNKATWVIEITPGNDEEVLPIVKQALKAAGAVEYRNYDNTNNRYINNRETGITR